MKRGARMSEIDLASLREYVQDPPPLVMPANGYLPDTRTAVALEKILRVLDGMSQLLFAKFFGEEPSHDFRRAALVFDWFSRRHRATIATWHYGTARQHRPTPQVTR